MSHMGGDSVKNTFSEYSCIFGIYVVFGVEFDLPYQ